MKKTAHFLSHVFPKRQKGNLLGKRKAMTFLLFPAAMLFIPLLSAFSAFADGEGFSYQIVSVSPASGSVHNEQRFEIMYGEPLVLEVSASQTCKLEVSKLGFASRNISLRVTRISDTQYRVTFSPDENEDYEGSNTAYLAFRDADDTLLAECKLHLQATAFHVRSVTIEKKTVKMLLGQSCQLHAALVPSSAPEGVDMGVTWESDDPDVADVSEDGVVIAKALGSTIICAFGYPQSSLVYDTCSVEVVDNIPTENIALSYVEGSGSSYADATLTLAEGERADFTADVTPDNSTDTVTWESSDAGIVSVDGSGGVTAVSMGSASVTARAGGKSASVTVRVLKYVPGIPANCSNDGNTEYWQDKDGKKYADSTGTEEITDTLIPSLGHSWGEWEVTTPATCEEAGVETRTCTRDASHKETREIAALGHDWGEWTVTKEATETEAGEKERVCQNDNSHKETQPIPARGADHYEFTVDNAFQWTKGSSDGLKMVIKNTSGDDGETFGKFKDVYVDGSKLTRDTDYTAQAGSIAITLSAEYLNSLSAGEHTLKVELTVTSVEHFRG